MKIYDPDSTNLIEIVFNEPPLPHRYKGESEQDAIDMREHIEIWDEVAAKVVRFDGVYYTVYCD